MALVHLTDKNFKDEVLSAKLPVLVDFFADWCGPCKVIAPIIEELAKEYTGKLKVGKLNVDDGQDTASNYAVMSIPTLMLFKGGKVIEQAVGALTKQQLRQKIDAHL